MKPRQKRKYKIGSAEIKSSQEMKEIPLRSATGQTLDSAYVTIAIYEAIKSGMKFVLQEDNLQQELPLGKLTEREN